MDEKKIEACAQAAFEARHEELFYAIKDAQRSAVRSDVRAIFNGEPGSYAAWFVTDVLRAAAVWDAAIDAATDAIDAVRETLDCEEASGAHDALRAVESLK